MKSEEFYLFLRSDDSADLFTSNSFTDFRVQLPSQIDLSHTDPNVGVWQLSLNEVSLENCPEDLLKDKGIVMTCDLAQSSYYRNSYRQIVRYFPRNNITTASLLGPMYLQLIKPSFRNVHVSLLDEKCVQIVDTTERSCILCCTLHFQLVGRILQE